MKGQFPRARFAPGQKSSVLGLKPNRSVKQNGHAAWVEVVCSLPSSQLVAEVASRSFVLGFRFNTLRSDSVASSEMGPTTGSRDQTGQRVNQHLAQHVCVRFPHPASALAVLKIWRLVSQEIACLCVLRLSRWSWAYIARLPTVTIIVMLVLCVLG